MRKVALMAAVYLVALHVGLAEASMFPSLQCSAFPISEMNMEKHGSGYAVEKHCVNPQGETTVKYLLTPIAIEDSTICLYGRKTIYLSAPITLEDIDIYYLSRLKEAQCAPYGDSYVAMDLSFEEDERLTYFYMLEELLRKFRIKNNTSMDDFGYSLYDRVFCSKCREFQNLVLENKDNISLIYFKKTECVYGGKRGGVCLSLGINHKRYNLSLEAENGKFIVRYVY